MDFSEFNAYHTPALERDEVRHILILGLMIRLAEQGAIDQAQTWSFGRPGACAIRTDQGHGLVLGEVTLQDCRELALLVAGTEFHSVVGPDRTALWFVERALELGERFAEPMPQRIHALTEMPNYPGAAGEARPLTIDDIDLFTEWLLAFVAEAVPEDPIPSREAMERTAASGNYLLWEVSGEPVSMAGIVRRTRNSGAIAAVYTPPELRGRGYAGSVTAATVEKIYAEGRKSACLYTDLRNPASNRCYEKIGFKSVCDSWHFFQV